MRSLIRLVSLLCAVCWSADFARSQAHTHTLASNAVRRTIELKGQTHHVQGMDFRGDKLWVTSVDTAGHKGYLLVFSLRTGALKSRVELQDTEHFHPGGVAVRGKSIWIPVAEYRPHSSSVIQRRNATTLQLEHSFRVPDHIGCLALVGDRLVGGNWDSREFYVWDPRGNQVMKISAPTQNAYQDMKFDRNYLIGSGLLPDHSGAIDWLSFPDLTLRRRITVGNTDHGLPFTREGMAIRGKRLLLLPEDGNSRIFEFRLR